MFLVFLLLILDVVFNELEMKGQENQERNLKGNLRDSAKKMGNQMISFANSAEGDISAPKQVTTGLNCPQNVLFQDPILLVQFYGNQTDYYHTLFINSTHVYTVTSDHGFFGYIISRRIGIERYSDKSVKITTNILHMYYSEVSYITFSCEEFLYEKCPLKNYTIGYDGDIYYDNCGTSEYGNKSIEVIREIYTHPFYDHGFAESLPESRGVIISSMLESIRLSAFSMNWNVTTIFKGGMMCSITSNDLYYHLTIFPSYTIVDEVNKFISIKPKEVIKFSVPLNRMATSDVCEENPDQCIPSHNYQYNLAYDMDNYYLYFQRNLIGRSDGQHPDLKKLIGLLSKFQFCFDKPERPTNSPDSPPTRPTSKPLDPEKPPPSLSTTTPSILTTQPDYSIENPTFTNIFHTNIDYCEIILFKYGIILSILLILQL